MRIGLDVTTAAQLTAAFAKAPEIVLDELETAMGSAVAYLLRETQENTPTASGVLRRSFFGRVDVLASLGAVFGTVGSSLAYALPVELGTKPHYPPLAPLISWVEQKLGITGEEAEARALAIQRRIGLVGTPGYGMARFALLDGRDSIQAEFDDAAERIQARLGGLA